ncbi:DnaB-like helicase C-terminal domain-containing protein [Collinsella sp. SGI.241]|uniref:DnaB-like helicase C-terminal domain-containing protein n=1 Tax=Collinsella sp. SGI.241 TaxID=3420557 RepID=UPI003D03BCD8
MPSVNSMSHGLNETVLDILRNNPLGHIEHSALDAILGGIRQYLCIVPGGPGTGKTTFMHQLGDSWAIAGHPVVIFEGELARASMLAKSLTRISGGELTYDDMYSGDMPAAKRELFDSTVDIYARSIAERMFIISGEIKNAGMRKAIEEVADKYGEPPLVIVDYAQIVTLPQELRIADERIGLKLVASELRRIVDEVHCPLFAISSINRMNYDKQTTGLQAIGGCNMFEYSADLVMSLSIKGDKPEERNANMLLKKRPVIASITKNRYGSCGVVEFEFNAPAATFTEIG